MKGCRYKDESDSKNRKLKMSGPLLVAKDGSE